MYQLEYSRLPLMANADTVFRTLFSECEYKFWLDSSLIQPGLSRFSFMGGGSKADFDVLTYFASERRLYRDFSGIRESEASDDPLLALTKYLQADVAHPPDIPFPFKGGYVGYFGFEVPVPPTHPTNRSAGYPDIYLLSARRYVVIDHEEAALYIVIVFNKEIGPEADRAWRDGVGTRLSNTHALRRRSPASTSEIVKFRLHFDHAAYLQRIHASLEAISAGESYEICLTNQLYCDDINIAPVELYLDLRQANPAPYGAFLEFGDLAVLCSSPERFLTISQDGVVESKPIKGTAAREADATTDALRVIELQSDEKSRSENLMITDLLRNDLGQVCEIGSVHVPKLMEVESYRTVHQLVSTVRGVLRHDASSLDCLKAAFPGGSMTGAPKKRTLEIIDALEERPRGIYSGSIGWLGFNGALDLNIVIRTIIVRAGMASIGVGGAIVALSDPESEYDEIVLKAAASMQAIARCLTGDPANFIVEGDRSSCRVEIRPALASDVDDVLAGLNSLLQELGGSYSPSVRSHSRSLLKTVVSGHAPGRVLVGRLRESGTFLGFISWNETATLRQGSIQATIEELWVAPEHRSKNVGSSLLDAMSMRCKARGIRRIEVGLPRSTYDSLERTRRFYQTYGFLSVGERLRKDFL